MSDVSCMGISDRLWLLCLLTYIMLLLETDVHCVLMFRKMHKSSCQESTLLIAYRIVCHNLYHCCCFFVVFFTNVVLWIKYKPLRYCAINTSHLKKYLLYSMYFFIKMFAFLKTKKNKNHLIKSIPVFHRLFIANRWC